MTKPVEQKALPETHVQSEETLTTEGQRHINRIWEYTQAFIAIASISTVLVVTIANTFFRKPIPIPEVLQNMVFCVIGFYFSRVNHEATGGVGRQKSKPPYVGR